MDAAPFKKPNFSSIPAIARKMFARRFRFHRSGFSDRQTATKKAPPLLRRGQGDLTEGPRRDGKERAVHGCEFTREMMVPPENARAAFHAAAPNPWWRG
jgi:hypothetical protein